MYDEKMEYIACRIVDVGPENIDVSFAALSDRNHQAFYRFRRRNSDEILADIPADGDATKQLTKALARKRVDAYALFRQSSSHSGGQDPTALSSEPMS